MALVCSICMHGSRSADEGVDCTCVSGRCSIPVFGGDRRVAAVAGVPVGFRTGAFSADCGAVAYSGGAAKYWRSRRPRIFLVLFRQRTFSEIFGQALSAGLQQAALGPL